MLTHNRTPQSSTRAKGSPVPALRLHLLAIGLLLSGTACVSSFQYEPAPGHPARADATPSATPPRITPFDYEPPPMADDEMDPTGGGATERQPTQPTADGDGHR